MKRHGFTLVELMIVIGIVAALMALLVPVGYRAREQGKIAYCLNNLREIGVAMHMYADDNYGRLPPTGDGSSLVWAPLLLPYVDNIEIFKCPTRYAYATEIGGDFSYAYNVSMDELSIDTIYNAHTRIMVTEGSMSYLAERLLLFPIHLQGNNVLFVEGNAAWFRWEEINSNPSWW